MARIISPACIFDNLSASYGSENIITGISGQLEQGEALALIGPNGSGKTTLLRAILHLCKTTTGSVKIFNTTSHDEYKHQISYVPQISGLDPSFPITVKEVVNMGLYSRKKWYNRFTSKDKERVMQVLEKVGMQSKAKEKFGNLSGGQQQRVLVARAIISNPKLLLLDEPFNGLDQPNRKALIEIIRSLKGEKVSIIVSTHDLDLAYAVCEKALILKNKQIVFDTISKALTGENIALAYGACKHENNVYISDPPNLLNNMDTFTKEQSKQITSQSSNNINTKTKSDDTNSNEENIAISNRKNIKELNETVEVQETAGIKQCNKTTGTKKLDDSNYSPNEQLGL